MYNEFFGFSEKPFHITPDLSFLFMSSKHKEALSCMEYGIMGDMGVALITGEIGTGKTTLLRLFLKELPESALTACIFNTNVSAEQLLGLVIQEFGFAEVIQNKALMIKSIHEGLNRLYIEKKRPVLIIDDAQNLSLDALEEVRWLSNLQSDRRMLVQVILVGQPELRTKLKEPALASLAQRIGINYHLRPFTREEAGRYIVHRLEAVNGNMDLFTGEAVNLIYNSSGGIPRTINLLCDNALVYAFADEKKKVDAPIVEQVLAEIYPEGLWELPSRSSGKEAAESKPQGTFQQLDMLQEELAQLTDNYTQELRNMIKCLLENQQRYYAKLSAEYSRFKERYRTLQKTDAPQPHRPSDEQRPNGTPSAQKTRSVVVKLSDTKNETGRG